MTVTRPFRLPEELRHDSLDTFKGGNSLVARSATHPVELVPTCVCRTFPSSHESICRICAVMCSKPCLIEEFSKPPTPLHCLFLSAAIACLLSHGFIFIYLARAWRKQTRLVCLMPSLESYLTLTCLQGFLNFSVVAFVTRVSGNPCCPALVVSRSRTPAAFGG